MDCNKQIMNAVAIIFLEIVCILICHTWYQFANFNPRCMYILGNNFKITPLYVILNVVPHIHQMNSNKQIMNAVAIIFLEMVYIFICHT